MSAVPSETSKTEAKTKKAPPEQVAVVMEDGTTKVFVGKRRMLKDYTVNEDGSVTARFDFVNGAVRSITMNPDDSLFAQAAGHGLIQKGGDEAAGDETVEDMVIHVEAILERLAKGEWGAERGTGDGFSGASVVIRAIMEAKAQIAAEQGKSEEEVAAISRDQASVKAYIEKALEKDKAAGGSLTRQKLYQSYRAPGTRTAAIIERIEREKASKNVAVDAEAELEAMMGA